MRVPLRQPRPSLFAAFFNPSPPTPLPKNAEDAKERRDQEKGASQIRAVEDITVEDIIDRSFRTEVKASCVVQSERRGGGAGWVYDLNEWRPHLRPLVSPAMPAVFFYGSFRGYWCATSTTASASTWRLPRTRPCGKSTG